MADGSSIFALSSGAGRAGIAVIRVSGPSARSVLERLAQPMPKARMAAFRTLRHPQTGEALDKAVVILFEARSSETGEDVAELQVHGGRAVVQAVLAAIATVPGCRPAQAGEFARRAFENGKLDLAQAEGLADLVDAETEAQRRQALAQSSGALSRLYEGWRQDVIAISALVEAAIDFSDEGDVGSTAFDGALARTAPLIEAIRRHLDDGHRGEILRDGFRVALLGPPNAGKSSLLNVLAGREAAIVSAEAGTTRDVVEVRLDLGGLPVIVSDTAGIRAAGGVIEREGIRRSLAAAKAADLVVWLDAPGIPGEPPAGISRETSLFLRAKADLTPEAGQGPGLAVSAKTGLGIDRLVADITRRALGQIGSGEAPALTQARHRHHLEIALAALQTLLAEDRRSLELRAEDVRQAASALGRITGRVDAEDILGEIFGRFCIGK